MSPWSSLWTTSATNGAAIPALDADIVWKGLLKQSSWFCMVSVSIRSRHYHAYCTNRRMGKDTLKEILTLPSVDRVRILSNRHMERIPEILKERQADRKSMEVSEGPVGNPECMGGFIEKADYVIDPAAVIPPLSGQKLASHRCNISGGRRLLSCYISVRVS